MTFETSVATNSLGYLTQAVGETNDPGLTRTQLGELRNSNRSYERDSIYSILKGVVNNNRGTGRSGLSDDDFLALESVFQDSIIQGSQTDSEASLDDDGNLDLRPWTFQSENNRVTPLTQGTSVWSAIKGVNRQSNSHHSLIDEHIQEVIPEVNKGIEARTILGETTSTTVPLNESIVDWTFQQNDEGYSTVQNRGSETWGVIKGLRDGLVQTNMDIANETSSRETLSNEANSIKMMVEKNTADKSQINVNIHDNINDIQGLEQDVALLKAEVRNVTSNVFQSNVNVFNQSIFQWNGGNFDGGFFNIHPTADFEDYNGQRDWAITFTSLVGFSIINGGGTSISITVRNRTNTNQNFIYGNEVFPINNNSSGIITLYCVRESVDEHVKYYTNENVPVQRDYNTFDTTHLKSFHNNNSLLFQLSEYENDNFFIDFHIVDKLHLTHMRNYNFPLPKRACWVSLEEPTKVQTSGSEFVGCLSQRFSGSLISGSDSAINEYVLYYSGFNDYARILIGCRADYNINDDRYENFQQFSFQLFSPTIKQFVTFIQLGDETWPLRSFYVLYDNVKPLHEKLVEPNVELVDFLSTDDGIEKSHISYKTIPGFFLFEPRLLEEGREVPFNFGGANRLSKQPTLLSLLSNPTMKFKITSYEQVPPISIDGNFLPILPEHQYFAKQRITPPSTITKQQNVQFGGSFGYIYLLPSVPFIDYIDQ